MLRVCLVAVTAFLAATASASSAKAENQTQIEKLKIEAEYDACTTEKTQQVEYCATETWSIQVNPDGWTATSTGTDGAPPVLESSITCVDGKYKSITNGQPWAGQCELTGDAAHPCFHITGGGSKEAFSKVETLQCFDVAQDACTMTVDGVIVGEAEAVKGEYVIGLKEMKSCRIVD
jgi:hypothetical protein